MAPLTWERERGLPSLIENASDVITVVEPDLTVVFQTSSGTRLLGHATSEVEAAKFASLVHPADLERLRTACAAAADGVRSGPIDVRLRHSNGDWIDVEIAVRHQADEGYLVLTTRDARERKRAERKLKRQAEQQAVVAELGARALEGGQLHDLVVLAASEIGRVLGADFAGLHQHVPEREAFVLFGGVGLDSFRRHGAAIAQPGSWLGDVLASRRTQIVPDWSRGARFSEAAFFQSSGIVSGIAAPVPAPQRPFGVLSAQARRPG